VFHKVKQFNHGMLTEQGITKNTIPKGTQKSDNK